MKCLVATISIVEPTGSRTLFVVNFRCELLIRVHSIGRLSPEWLAYAPLGGLNLWRHYTKVYASQLQDQSNFRDAGRFQNAVFIPYTSITAVVL
jgi:hypothetical protein